MANKIEDIRVAFHGLNRIGAVTVGLTTEEWDDDCLILHDALTFDVDTFKVLRRDERYGVGEDQIADAAGMTHWDGIELDHDWRDTWIREWADQKYGEARTEREDLRDRLADAQRRENLFECVLSDLDSKDTVQ